MPRTTGSCTSTDPRRRGCIITRKTSLTITAAVLAIATAGVLAGCSAPAGHDITPTTTPSASAEPEAVEGDFDGDGKVTSWDLEQLAKSTYTMPDGSKVPIETGQPLPAQVVEAVEQALAPVAAEYIRVAKSNPNGAEKPLFDAIAAQEAKINRQIVPITHVGADALNRGWAVGYPAPTVSGGYSTREQAVAHATEWVNGSTSYVVVVLD